MSYHRKRLGDDDPAVDCEETPDDEVCQAFYAKPAAQPAPAESGGLFTGFADFIKKGVESLKEASGLAPIAPVAPAAAAATKPTTAKSSLVPIVVVGGGAVALWMYLRKRK